MARFLLAWELGDGLGHASRFRPLAQSLRERGHEVDLMLREIVHARSVLGDLGLRVLQAPFWMHQTVGGPNPTISLTEILVGNGYLQPEHLDGLVQGWLAAFDLIRPDVLVADYAPTATIAARIRGIPVATVGGGFYLPPDASPLPPFRTWEPIEPGRIAYWEQRVTQTVNAVLARHGAPPLPRLSTILRGDKPLLCCWPELDPYQRHTVRATGSPVDAALGPTFLNEGGEAPQWPDGAGPRVFAYVRSTHGDLLAVLQALDDAGCRTLCYLPEVAAGRPAPLVSPRIRYASRPVDLAQALPQADLLISHAGEATLAQALLAGVPMLLLPTQAEQFLNAQGVVALGAGLNAAAHGQPVPYPALLHTLLNNPMHGDTYRAAAQRMAARYRDFLPNALNQTLTAACESLLNGH